MWAIRKPDLKDTLSDIDVFEQNGIVACNDAKALKCLVKQYDSQFGQVTSGQHSKITKSGADSIHRNYSETYEGKSLSFIRKALYENVSKCPYCAIGQSETLDHYMPKSNYKALALCRLNLIPMCWNCNRKKGYTKPYIEFIHPYYLHIPRGTIFLIADIQIISNQLIVTFSFDANALKRTNLLLQFSSHWANMGLDERLRKSVTDFIHSEVLPLSDDADVLLASIDVLVEKTEKGYGLNDWRSTVLRALSQILHSNQKDLVVRTLISMKSKTRDINI